MGEKENVQIVERMWRSVSEGDLSVLAESLADDCIQEWPQSGERVHGKANIIAINTNYPGLPKVTIRRTRAAGNLVVSEVDLNYGGKSYQAVSIMELEGGKIVRECEYFAEPFDAPDWRAQWVERS